jgi:sulfur relay (sulfurtransferase) DsrF/TusC family protein
MDFILNSFFIKLCLRLGFFFIDQGVLLCNLIQGHKVPSFKYTLSFQECHACLLLYTISYIYMHVYKE